MTTNKQKRKLRIRQKIYDKKSPKERQIREMMKQLDALPIDPLTGNVIFPESKDS